MRRPQLKRRVIREEERTAGKTFTCGKCGQPIYEGSKYLRTIVEVPTLTRDPFSDKPFQTVTEKRHLLNGCPSQITGRSPHFVIIDDISQIDERVFDALSRKRELWDDLLPKMNVRSTDFHHDDLADTVKYGGPVGGAMVSSADDKLAREKYLRWYTNVLRDHRTPTTDEKA